MAGARKSRARWLLFAAGVLAGAFPFGFLWYRNVLDEQSVFASYRHPVVIANGSSAELWVSATSLIHAYNSLWLHGAFGLNAETHKLVSGERKTFWIPNEWASDDLFLIKAVCYPPSTPPDGNGPPPEVAVQIIKFKELEVYKGGWGKMNLDEKATDVVLLDKDLFPATELPERLPSVYLKAESRAWPVKGAAGDASATRE